MTSPAKPFRPQRRSRKTYDVLFEGHLRRGQRPETAACSLLAAGILSKESIARALSGFPVTVATGVSPEQAEMIRSLFHNAGALCKVLPADPNREQRPLIFAYEPLPVPARVKRRLPAGLLAAFGLATLVAALMFKGRSQPGNENPPPAQTALVPAGPERVLSILPGERQELTVEFALPVVLDDTSTLSLKTAIKISQNEWFRFGVNASVVSQSIEEFSVPVWFIREASGSRVAPGVSSVPAPPGLPKAFDPARFKDLGITADPGELIAAGNLTEDAYRTRLFSEGHTLGTVERSRLRIQRARVTVAIDIPKDKRFSGEDSSSRGVFAGTDQYYVSTGSAGVAFPVSWRIWLPLQTVRGEPGLFLLRPPQANWKPVDR